MAPAQADGKGEESSIMPAPIEGDATIDTMLLQG
jgi:hypothetical protein